MPKGQSRVPGFAPHRVTRRAAYVAAAVALSGSSACAGGEDAAAARTAGATAAAESTWAAPRAPDVAAGRFPADTPATPSTQTSRAPPGSTASGAPGPATRGPQATTPAPATTSAGARTAPSGGRVPGDTASRSDTGSSVAATPPPAAAVPAAPPPIPPRAFAVGERLTYDVRFGPIRVGQASMEVVGIEPLRGRDAYHTRFTVRGGTAFYRVNDRYESWFDARTLESLRYAQQIDQGSYERERLFEMFPDQRTFTEGGRADHQPSVADPLDDGSFLYFLRTIPLEVGRTYEFNRYFRPDRNPVRVTVVRRERVRVPAGTFDAIVVRPTIKTTGIFSEGGRAEVWFADDSTRRMIQMKSRLSFGSLNLYLRRVEP